MNTRRIDPRALALRSVAALALALAVTPLGAGAGSTVASGHVIASQSFDITTNGTFTMHAVTCDVGQEIALTVPWASDGLGPPGYFDVRVLDPSSSPVFSGSLYFELSDNPVTSPVVGTGIACTDAGTYELTVTFHDYAGGTYWSTDGTGTMVAADVVAPTPTPTPPPTVQDVALVAADRDRLDLMTYTAGLGFFVVAALLAGVLVTTGLRR